MPKSNSEFFPCFKREPVTNSWHSAVVIIAPFHYQSSACVDVMLQICTYTYCVKTSHVLTADFSHLSEPEVSGNFSDANKFTI